MKVKTLLPFIAGLALISNVTASEKPVNIKIQAQQPGSSYYSYATTLSRGTVNLTTPQPIVR